jgi:hypothetical protein
MPAPTVSPARTRRAQRQAPRWASRAARDLGLGPSTIESRINTTSRRTAQDELATILRRLIETGNLRLAEKVAAPILAALASIPVPALDADVICRAVEADEEEAILRARYQATPSPATLRAWRVGLETARASALPLYLALVAAERAE